MTERAVAASVADRRREMALDAPRRARRHAAHLPDHREDMFATRAVAGDGTVDLELLRYRPLAAGQRTPVGAAISVCGGRRWVVTVQAVESHSVDMPSDALAARLLALEKRAFDAERNAVAQAEHAREREIRSRQARQLRHAAANGIADGVNGWRS